MQTKQNLQCSTEYKKTPDFLDLTDEKKSGAQLQFSDNRQGCGKHAWALWLKIGLSWSPIQRITYTQNVLKLERECRGPSQWLFTSFSQSQFPGISVGKLKRTLQEHSKSCWETCSLYNCEFFYSLRLHGEKQKKHVRQVCIKLPPKPSHVHPSQAFSALKCLSWFSLSVLLFIYFFRQSLQTRCKTMCTNPTTSTGKRYQYQRTRQKCGATTSTKELTTKPCCSLFTTPASRPPVLV